jgi:Bacterial protein of unknown function (DUF899)
VEEWLAARLELLEEEKALTRRSDELARRRREVPWVRVEKEYLFDTDDGTRTLAELFDGRSQLLVYHFMFGPSYEAGCPTCSSMADTVDGALPHLFQPISASKPNTTALAALSSHRSISSSPKPQVSGWRLCFTYYLIVSGCPCRHGDDLHGDPSVIRIPFVHERLHVGVGVASFADCLAAKTRSKPTTSKPSALRFPQHGNGVLHADGVHPQIAPR